MDKDNVDSTSADGIGVLNVNQTRTGTSTFTGAVLASTTLTVGVNDTGYDVKFFGASSGAFMEWDESADELEIRGATAAGPGKLLLSTGELTNVDAGILGRIDFQAPLDSAGTDAIEVGASIWAEADATFSSSVNTTDLVFAAATSEAAAAVMRMKKESLSPNTTNGMSLGTTALNWSDLFLDSGGVINFDSGNVTVTHSSGTLTVAGNVAATDLDGIIGSNTAAAGTFTTVNFSSSVVAANAAGPSVLNEAATATNPTLVPNKAELDTGIGWAASDSVSVITGGTERMRVDATGNRTMPTNCAFYCESSEVANVTGDGTAYTMIFATELYDKGSDFSTSTFTAPVAGIYTLGCVLNISGILSSHTDGRLHFPISTGGGSKTFSVLIDDLGTDDMGGFMRATYTIMAEMAASDTATLVLTVSNGTKVVDVDGGNSFYGMLMQ